jgi:hypothetical protein
MKKMTRKEAKAKGLKRYFTGNACKNGHITERYTCNYECVECDKLRKGVVRTKVEVVSVKKKTVRIVKFLVVGTDRRGLGKKKFSSTVLEDRMVAVG